MVQYIDLHTFVTIVFPAIVNFNNFCFPIELVFDLSFENLNNMKDNSFFSNFDFII